MRAPATATGSRQAFSICITASCSRPSPHWRYLIGSVRGGGGAFNNALANSPRKLSSVKADGLAMIAFTSSSKRALSPPLRMYLLMKSVALRVASPSGTPRRIKSLVFIIGPPVERLFQHACFIAHAHFRNLFHEPPACDLSMTQPPSLCGRVSKAGGTRRMHHRLELQVRNSFQ